MAASPEISRRVRDLVERMSLDEKLAQLGSYWVDQGDEVVAPMAGELASTTAYEDATAHGIGHLTRVYGTRPVEPVERAAWLWAEQRRLRDRSGHGIPALVHEECLTGLAAWKAATFPTPLAWGASFDPEAVAEMGRLIGESMRSLGIHQGLAPVLDVVRDPRWGRVDECIAEDPYVVGVLGTAYVRGLQSAGVEATLKHFVGYSASRAGRNHAPVSMGVRELEDVLLPPFEMAVRDGGVRSVMNSYAEIDGEPIAGTPRYLEGILRERWGFDGVVVSDYFAVRFLHTAHAVAEDLGDAAALALEAGVDVELPSTDAFGAPLRARIVDGRADAALVDRAVGRVLAQKERLGLLDARFDEPPAWIDLDSPAHRAVARRIAQESVVLLANDGLLPLAPPRRIAVIGPNADSAEGLMGCYSFANHVLAHHPSVELGFAIPTLRDAFASEFAGSRLSFAQGCAIEGDDRSGIPEAIAVAAAADVAVVVVGDRAGLFGRGTVGEGNDVESLELPGVQRELVEQIVASGTPVVMVCITGRPYALDWAIDGLNAPRAVLQSFFPGEEGAAAIAEILSGAASPSGRLPVSMPRSAGAQPYTYLHPVLGGPNDVTSADSSPVLPFGFGLGYTLFEHEELTAPPEVAAGESVTVTVRVRNCGERSGTDVVQLYAHDVVGSVTRPVAQLVAFERVALDAGEEAVVVFDVPPTRLGFTGRDGVRIVEPGEVRLWVGGSCADRETETSMRVTGGIHHITADDERIVGVRVDRVPEPAVVSRS